jgi:hypothetical protein
MVAIVSGDSLGLMNTSAGVLGKNGLIGQGLNGASVKFRHMGAISIPA